MSHFDNGFVLYGTKAWIFFIHFYRPLVPNGTWKMILNCYLWGTNTLSWNRFCHNKRTATNKDHIIDIGILAGGS